MNKQNLFRDLDKYSKLGDNWDGYGANKPKASAIADVRELINRMADDCDLPFPVSHADGNMLLFRYDYEHEQGGRCELHMEFYGDGTFGYLIHIFDGDDATGEMNIDDNFPYSFALVGLIEDDRSREETSEADSQSASPPSPIGKV